MTDLRQISDDLVAEQDALDAVVDGRSDEQWMTPTSSEGWTVADQIGHLTYFDGAAATAITDPEAFKASITELMKAAGSGIDETLHRHLCAADLLERWRANRRHLAEVASTLTEGTRVIWYGPPMSAKSFLTARLMEVWAHGQDVVDALGAERPATDRIGHIAQLGFITRAWSYTNRGMDVPAGDVRLALVAPSGQTWRFGADDAVDVITGPGVDFCLVVTQRRHVDDTTLEVAGDAARDWMEKAQTFAGPPSYGPPPRGRLVSNDDPAPRGA